MAVSKGFGDRVAQERRHKSFVEQRDVRKKDIAKAVGVDSSTVGRWESGSIPDDDETLMRIAKFYGVSVAWLRYGPPYPRTAESDIDPDQRTSRATASHRPAREIDPSIVKPAPRSARKKDAG